jgi:divalent metal cation (Fe/Co/Zn/Cd) transporter
MIAASAALAAWESFQRLIHPQTIDNLGWVSAAAMMGFIGNETVARYRIRTGERIGSAALVADGYHARTDGFLLVVKDAGRQIWHRLMDAVDPGLLQQARTAAESASGVESVSEVRARWIGHALHAEVLLTAAHTLPLSESHAVAERARHAMLHAVPKLGSVTVHVDPNSFDGHDHHADLAHHDNVVT